jgi:hypothetical protein
MRPEKRDTLSIENSPWGLAKSTGFAECRDPLVS